MGAAITLTMGAASIYSVFFFLLKPEMKKFREIHQSVLIPSHNQLYLPAHNFLERNVG